jgi:streptogramin lyase
MKLARLDLTAFTVGAAVTAMGVLAGTTATKATITEYQIPNSVANGPNGDAPHGIAAGPDGALWFTLIGSPPPGKIGRITTGGVITAFPLPDAGGAPDGITAGPAERCGSLTSAGRPTGQ